MLETKNFCIAPTRIWGLLELGLQFRQPQSRNYALKLLCTSISRLDLDRSLTLSLYWLGEKQAVQVIVLPSSFLAQKISHSCFPAFNALQKAESAVFQSVVTILGWYICQMSAWALSSCSCWSQKSRRLFSWWWRSHWTYIYSPWWSCRKYDPSRKDLDMICRTWKGPWHIIQSSDDIQFICKFDAKVGRMYYLLSRGFRAPSFIAMKLTPMHSLFVAEGTSACLKVPQFSSWRSREIHEG